MRASALPACHALLRLLSPKHRSFFSAYFFSHRKKTFNWVRSVKLLEAGRRAPCCWEG
jgi:hypothetical protein